MEFEAVENTTSSVQASPRAMVMIPRALFWSGILMGMLVIASGVVVKEHWYRPLWHRYQAAQITLKVKENGSFAVADADVQIAGLHYRTDAAGQVNLGALAGNYTVTVDKDGFSSITNQLALKRGDNGEKILALAPLPAPQYSIVGYLHDAVSDKPIVNAAVSVGTQTLTTNPDGEYRFANLQPGSYDLKIVAPGYAPHTETLAIAHADIVENPVNLTPNGQAIFVSNRDGKRGLYTVGFDGSNVKKLTDPGSGEDFAPVLSPDGTMLAFSSTRDGVRDPYGTLLATLYLINLDGSNLRKIGDGTAAQHAPIWSANSAWIYDKSQTASGDASIYTIYDVQHNKSMDVGDAVVNPFLSPDSTLLAYTVFTSSEQPGPTPDAAPVRVNSYDVRTFNLITGEHTTLVNKPQYIESLSFSVDMTTLSYDVTVNSQRHRYSVNLATHQETEVALDTPSTRQYIQSPNGAQQVFVETRDGQSDLFLVKKDGTGEQRLTTLGTVSQQIAPRWDSTGHYITFAVVREGESAIYITAINGNTPKKLTDFNP